MITPNSSCIDLNTGVVSGSPLTTRRKLSEMSTFFNDAKAVKEVLQHRDPVIYEAYELRTQNEDGSLSWCTTIIDAGIIGQEYYMTKGHFHKKDTSTELYLGVKGKGLLVLQDRADKFLTLSIEPGIMVNVPPSWAHRVVNTSNERLIFIAIYDSVAGHDYSFIGEKGFAKLVLQIEGKCSVFNNPRYGI